LTVELEQRTHMLETAVSLWTQYVQLVSHLHEHLSNVSDKLQSDIRPSMHTADLTSLANVLKMNQVFFILYLVDVCLMFCCISVFLHCFDVVGWVTGRPVKTESVASYKWRKKIRVASKKW